MSETSAESLLLQTHQGSAQQKIAHLELVGLRVSSKLKSTKKELDNTKKELELARTAGSNAFVNVKDEELKPKLFDILTQVAALKEIISELSNHIECPLHSGPFCTPLTLTCGHTYCETCLEKWYKQYPQYSGYPEGSIKGLCPECRVRTGFLPKEARELASISPLLVSLEKELNSLFDKISSV